MCDKINLELNVFETKNEAVIDYLLDLNKDVESTIRKDSYTWVSGIKNKNSCSLKSYGGFVKKLESDNSSGYKAYIIPKIQSLKFQRIKSQIDTEITHITDDTHIEGSGKTITFYRNKKLLASYELCPIIDEEINETPDNLSDDDSDNDDDDDMDNHEETKDGAPNKELLEKIKELTDKLENTNKERQDIIKKHEQITIERDKTTKKIEEKLNDLENNLKTKEENITSLNRIIDNIKEEKMQLEEKKKELENNNEKLELENKNNKNEIEKLNETNENLKIQLQSLEKQLSEMKEQQKEAMEQKQKEEMVKQSSPEDMEISPPEAMDQQSSPEAMDQQSSPEAMDQQSSPEAMEQQSSPEAMDQQSSPEAMEQQSSPEAMEQSNRVERPEQEFLDEQNTSDNTKTNEKSGGFLSGIQNMFGWMGKGQSGSGIMNSFNNALNKLISSANNEPKFQAGGTASIDTKNINKDSFLTKFISTIMPNKNKTSEDVHNCCSKISPMLKVLLTLIKESKDLDNTKVNKLLEELNTNYPQLTVEQSGGGLLSGISEGFSEQINVIKSFFNKGGNSDVQKMIKELKTQNQLLEQQNSLNNTISQYNSIKQQYSEDTIDKQIHKKFNVGPIKRGGSRLKKRTKLRILRRKTNKKNNKFEKKSSKLPPYTPL